MPAVQESRRSGKDACSTSGLDVHISSFIFFFGTVACR